MMTHRISALAALFLLIGPSFLSAQEQTEKYPPPHAPFVAAVPEYAQWTLSVSNSGGAASANKAPAATGHVLQSLASAKAGALKQDVFTYGDNTSEEEWYMASALLKADASDKKAVMVFDGAGTGGGGYTTLHGRGFPGMGWMKEGDFDKVVRLQNKDCYHFVRAGEGLEAWIDTGERLPVACRIDGAVYVYHFGTPPTSLTLPPNFQAAYDAYEKLRKHREQLQHDLGGH